jgi:hypothetical protein
MPELILMDLDPGGPKIYGSGSSTVNTACRYFSCTVNLFLVTIKYKNPSWKNKTFPQKYVYDFKE